MIWLMLSRAAMAMMNLVKTVIITIAMAMPMIMWWQMKL